MTAKYYLQNTSTGEKLLFPDEVVAAGFIILGDDQAHLDQKYPGKYTWPAIYKHGGNIWQPTGKTGPLSGGWDLITETASTQPNQSPAQSPGNTVATVDAVADGAIKIEDYYEYSIYNSDTKEVIKIPKGGLRGNATWMSLDAGSIEKYGYTSPAVYNLKEHYSVHNNGEAKNNWSMVQQMATWPDLKRLYNSGTGKHLFSDNKYEVDVLTGQGWKNEGSCFASAKDGSGTADVYRFLVASEGRHFYTALESEKDSIIANQSLTDAGWKFEGKAFSAYSKDDYPKDAIACVRYLNLDTGSHVYSTSTSEQEILNANSIWKNEGVAWYANIQSDAI